MRKWEKSVNIGNRHLNVLFGMKKTEVFVQDWIKYEMSKTVVHHWHTPVGKSNKLEVQ